MARTKEFDVRNALQRAMEVFWEHGYESTSMCDLLCGMGISRGSFYDTFGSKHGVLLQALQLYGTERFAELEKKAEGHSIREVVECFFSDLSEHQKCDQGRWGCMMLNAGIELAGHDPEVDALVQDTMARHERFFRDRIEADQESGMIRRDLDATQAASALLAMVLGAQVLARASFPRRGIVAVGELALRILE